MTKTLYTIGHSTHPLEEFLAMLRANDITQLIDVRSVPKSAHNPQYNKEFLSTYLRNHRINYAHYQDLGGLRHAKKASQNLGWHNASFRGYADYMQTPQFSEALDKLVKKTKDKNVAIMCAEALPWRCHRSMIADALVGLKDFEVQNIMSQTSNLKHKLTSFAKIKNGKITYP